MADEKTLNQQQSQQELRDAYYDFIAACMINEAYDTEENNLDQVLKELKDIDLDGLKEFASEFYHDELADLLSYETIKEAADSETPLDLLNSAELDEKVLQEYRDYQKEQEIREKLQAEAEKDLPEAYRAFIGGIIEEEKQTLKENPEAYAKLDEDLAGLQTLEQLRGYAQYYIQSISNLPDGPEWISELEAPDADKKVLGWYIGEKIYANSVQTEAQVSQQQPENAPLEMSEAEKEQILFEIDQYFAEQKMKKIQAEQNKETEQQNLNELREKEQAEQTKQQELEERRNQALEKREAQAKQEKENAELGAKIVDAREQKARENENRLNKIRKDLEARKEKQAQLKAEMLKRQEAEKKAAEENEKRRQLEDVLKEQFAEEIIDNEPEDVIDESLGGKSLEELEANQRKIESTKSFKMPKHSATVDSYDSKLHLDAEKKEPLNAAVFKDELRRLAKDLEKTVHIGQSNTQGFKDLQAALKEIRETKGEFKEEFVSKETFMQNEMIKKAMQACGKYTSDHADKNLDATQMQRLKIMSRIVNTIYMAEKGIEPNSISGMKEKLYEKYNNAKCIDILKNGKSTPEQKKSAKNAMLSFTTIGDKGHKMYKDAVKNIDGKIDKIQLESRSEAMLKTLKMPGAKFMKELDGPQNVNKAQKSTGMQK